MSSKLFKFSIEKRLAGSLGRAGLFSTPHGDIKTPAFVVVGTKASVKSLTPEQVASLGAQVVLANTYHLYLQPGEEKLARAGGLSKFMNWPGPTMTDSGGFQAFSLGSAFDKSVSKIVDEEIGGSDSSTIFDEKISPNSLAKVTEDGVAFKSVIDGSQHFFTPEKSIQIQQKIGADIIFVFDECTSPLASFEYQKQALVRTHRWAERSLAEHKKAGTEAAPKTKTEDQALAQALFGIVQGGRFEELRKESANFLASKDFDGFGIGGSFNKKDIDAVVGLVNSILPEEKPRHLLGIGEPIDIFNAVEQGIDTFDCVTPTRNARNGSLYTLKGKLNIMNARFVDDLSPIDSGCLCYTCQNFSRSYLAHLFRAHELLANTLASIHNLYFIVKMVDDIRKSILSDTFPQFKSDFLAKYYNGK